MLTYLHPILAAVVLALFARVVSLAVRARKDRRRATVLLAQHARWAPWLYALVWVSWLAGLATTHWLRPEREIATSGHFEVGAGLMLVLTGSAITSRFMHRPAVRRIHPWLGALSIWIAAAHIFFGLQIMP